MLSCSDMGIDDGFIAKGETDEEVMEKAMEHVKMAHMEKMKDMTEKQMMNMMKPMIKEM